MTATPSGVAGVLEEDVAFRRDDLTLYGTLARPATGPTGDFAALTLHGWGGTRSGPHRLFVLLGRELAAQGVPTLRFDLAGRGVSDGDTASAHLDGMIADTLAALALLKDRGWRRVFLVGLCSGGNVAIGAATLAQAAVPGLACVSTLPFAPQSAARGRRKALAYLQGYLRKACRLETWKRLLRGEVSLQGVEKTLTHSLHESDRPLKDSARDIMADFAGLRCPVTFIHGGADPETPEAEQHYRTFCEKHGIPAGFHTVAGANHNYYAIPWAEEVRQTVSAAVLKAKRDS